MREGEGSGRVGEKGIRYADNASGHQPPSPSWPGWGLKITPCLRLVSILFIVVDLSNVDFVNTNEQTRNLCGIVIHPTAVMKDHPFQTWMRRITGVRNEFFGKGMETFAN